MSPENARNNQLTRMSSTQQIKPNESWLSKGQASPTKVLFINK